MGYALQPETWATTRLELEGRGVSWFVLSPSTLGSLTPNILEQGRDACAELCLDSEGLRWLRCCCQRAQAAGETAPAVPHCGPGMCPLTCVFPPRPPHTHTSLDSVFPSGQWPCSLQSIPALSQVVCMSFFDIVLDFILMDAFEDLENPPSSVLAVLRNRWLSDSFKETVGGCPPHPTHAPVTPRVGLDPAFLRPWLWAPRLGPLPPPSGSGHLAGQASLPRSMWGCGLGRPASALEQLPRGG